MLIAQKLYEGLPLEKKRPVGLITYMRTDSPSVSKIAQNQAARFINENFGSQYLPAKPPYYIARLSSAQEAHEAIRPTHIDIPPEQIKKYLNRDYYAVYKLIWDRFIASQMTPAKVETITIVADAGEYTFEAFKSNRIFDGFTMIWPIKTDEGEKNIPPDITATDRIKLVDIISEEEKTKPPARYTEASLIKTLEKFGIGRPSTYAPIISTLFKRKYIRKNGKSFIPEKLGIMVSEMLSRYFSDIINVQFTAKMEKELDEIAEGEKNWIELLKNFYKRFKIYLDKATSEANFKIADSIEQQKNIPEPMGKNCPKCGKPLVIRTSRYGKFIGCTGFPKCRYIEKIEK
ncbi:MAG TPA: DNA topoisomerase, partial [bacterium]|nr:DNA topoisomerase [bacterium]